MTADRIAAPLIGALALLAASAAQAQPAGFAGLGAENDAFAEVVPGVALSFPEDHGPHRAFRTEWWYVTANLEGPDGARYGAQWTLFRRGIEPDAPDKGWDTGEIWMAHAAITTKDDHRAAETFARGGIGQAGVTLDPFEAWIDAWELRSTAGAGADPYAEMRLSAAAEGFAYDLALSADGPLVRHGEAGYSRKSERGQASYYYSQPFFRAEGVLTIDGAPVPVTGRAWLDREWSTRPMDPDQTGWDWFALHLGTGEKAMLYRFRQREGGDAFAGTWITAEGAAEPLDPDGVSMEPTRWATIAGRETPVRWRIEVPARGLAIDAAPLNPQSWNALTVAYWEGPIRVEGSHEGVGYLEMTGY
jgi:predicted secreted hydrolase